MRVFVTGASGWIGSAVVPELLDAGHEVVGLARSDASAAALAAAGAEVAPRRPRRPRRPARRPRPRPTASSTSPSSTTSPSRATSRRRPTPTARAIETFGAALAGSGRPLVIASGLAGPRAGRVATEEDVPDPARPRGHRGPLRAAPRSRSPTRGVRSSSVRLAPTVHGEGDHGFIAMLVGIAREHGRLGLRRRRRQPLARRAPPRRRAPLPAGARAAPAGSVLHAAAEEGVPTRDDRRGDRRGSSTCPWRRSPRGRGRALRLAGRLLRHGRPGLERAHARAAWAGSRRSPGCSRTSSRAATRASRSRRGSGGRVRGRARCREGAADSGSPHASLPHPPPGEPQECGVAYASFKGCGSSVRRASATQVAEVVIPQLPTPRRAPCTPTPRRTRAAGRRWSSWR